MGIISRSLGIQALSLEDPSQPLLPASAMFESLGLGRSDAGVLINVTQALRVTTAQTCIKVIGEDLSSTSHDILQRMPDGSMQVAYKHRCYPIIHDEPNEHMTAMVFWAAILTSALAWGNGYAFIKRDRAARVIGLVPLASGKTSPIGVKDENGKLHLMYATTQTDTGAAKFIDPEDVLHIMGLSLDGVTGISPIESCKNAFGLAMAAEKFGAQFFGNGARSSGVLTHPGVLEEEAYENLKKSVREWATGENGLRPIILEEGLDWKQISIAPNDAQFLQTRQYQRTEIAGLYRVPLHLIGDLQRATNNNIEHQSLDYIRYCLRPWAIRIEQEVNRKILGGPFTMEHNFKDMQRGDFASQTAGIQILRNIGYYSNNDIARDLRENPQLPEEGGDLRVIQGAMINITALLPGGDGGDSAATVSETESSATQPFDRITPVFQRLFRDAVGRTLNRKDPDADFIKRAFRPPVTSMAEAMIAMRFGNATLTRRELDKIDAAVSDIVTAAPAWSKKDAAVIAGRVTSQVYSALAREMLN